MPPLPGTLAIFSLVWQERVRPSPAARTWFLVWGSLLKSKVNFQGGGGVGAVLRLDMSLTSANMGCGTSVESCAFERSVPTRNKYMALNQGV